jgi:hypothetical protein
MFQPNGDSVRGRIYEQDMLNFNGVNRKRLAYANDYMFNVHHRHPPNGILTLELGTYPPSPVSQLNISFSALTGSVLDKLIGDHCPQVLDDTLLVGGLRRTVSTP